MELAHVYQKVYLALKIRAGLNVRISTAKNIPLVPEISPEIPDCLALFALVLLFLPKSAGVFSHGFLHADNIIPETGTHNQLGSIMVITYM